MTEADFLDRVGGALSAELGRPVAHARASPSATSRRLGPNDGDARPGRAASGPRATAWRCSRTTCASGSRAGARCFAVDELFELVVDSAFVGLRKPDPRDLPPDAATASAWRRSTCLFVDDLETNFEAARAVGLGAVHYRDPEQAVAEVLSALAGR